MSASRSTSRPRIRPSRSAAILIRCHWSRPWCTVMLPSLRDSVHLTGRPSLRAISTASTSSAVTCSLEPNPPPTSGAITRMFCSGIPVTRRQHDPQHVRDLGGRPQRDLAAHVGRHHRPRLHRARDQPLLPVGALDDHRGVAERRVQVPVGQRATRSSCCRPRAPWASPRPARSGCPAPRAAARSPTSTAASASAAVYRSLATTTGDRLAHVADLVGRPSAGAPG